MSALLKCLLSNQIGETNVAVVLSYLNSDFCYIISIRLRHKHLNKSLYIAFQTYAKYTFRFSTTNEGEVKTTTTTYRHEQTVLFWQQRSILGKQLLG